MSLQPAVIYETNGAGDLFEFIDGGAVFDGVEELDGILEDGAGGLEDIGGEREGEADEAEDAVIDPLSGSFRSGWGPRRLRSRRFRGSRRLSRGFGRGG